MPSQKPQRQIFSRRGPDRRYLVAGIFIFGLHCFFWELKSSVEVILWSQYTLLICICKMTRKQTTKLRLQNLKKTLSSNYTMLKIKRLEGKHCRSRWDSSLWAVSSGSAVFANSAIVVFGTLRVNPSLAAIYLPTWVPTAGFFLVCVFFSSASLKCHITSVLHLLPPQTQWENESPVNYL